MHEIRKFVVPSFPVNRYYTKAEADAKFATAGSSVTFQVVDVNGTIDGANTSFTLSSAPTNGVFFILLNKSVLLEGVHFTRSGTNLTYLFTPADDLAGTTHSALLY